MQVDIDRLQGACCQSLAQVHDKAIYLKQTLIAEKGIAEHQNHSTEFCLVPQTGYFVV